MVKPSSKEQLVSRHSRQGYIIKNFPASRDLYNYIWSLTKDIPIEGTREEMSEQREKYHRFIMHLFVSMRLGSMDKDKFMDGRGFVPIHSRLIERTFGRGFDPLLLKSMGLVEIKPHNTMGGQSREFRIVQEIFDEADVIVRGSLFQRLRALIEGDELSETVNLRTGRNLNTTSRSKLTVSPGGTRNTNIPELIRESIKSLKPCPFNPTYVYGWLEKLSAKYDRERKNFNKAKRNHKKGSPEYERAEKEFLKAQGRYINDTRGIETILNQNPRRLKRRSDKGDLLYEYQAAYSVQKSGRISEVNGGFQSSSKYLKQLLFRDMKGMKINYDLKNSQANILLQEFKACNLTCSWLDSYMKDPDAKKRYAEKVGIPVDIWKECFYSLIMGAETGNKYGTIYRRLNSHFKSDKKDTERAYRRFLKIVKNLIDVTEEWRDYVYRSRDRRYHYQHSGIKYWKNSCGMHFKDYGILDEHGEVLATREGSTTNNREIRKCKRKLAAFMLQGQEASFIHHLTVTSTTNDIPIYKNEHDGIIAGKEIPPELVRQARRKANLPGLELKKKPLCGREKRAEAKEYLNA